MSRKTPLQEHLGTKPRVKKVQPLTIGGQSVLPGERRLIEIPVARLYDFTEMRLPVFVIRGKRPGPVLALSGALHGDELNGVETIRRVLRRKLLRSIRGTLLAVPIVNVYGFNNKTRYLPDRRDLNREFPGSEKGSVTERLAHVFNNEVASKCTHAIDLHTGAIHRKNLPQIRVCLATPDAERLARAFGVPVILDARLRDGSLRQELVERQIPALVFEGGEALRFDEISIKTATRGVFAVMREIGMLPLKKETKKVARLETFVATKSYWVRAPESGILNLAKSLGSRVETDEVIGTVSDPLGRESKNITAKAAGIIVGQIQIPLVNQGDAISHIACFQNTHLVEEEIGDFDEYLDASPYEVR